MIQIKNQTIKTREGIKDGKPLKNKNKQKK